MITIFVGDVTDFLAKRAFQYASDAILLTTSNSQSLKSGTYYASMGDFRDYRSFVDTLDQADHIVYAPPNKWSDADKKNFSYMQQWTEH